MITLYHGSNVKIESICLDRCSPYKDFGKGFYLTDIEEQARQMAIRRTRIAGEGTPCITAYAFDERQTNYYTDAGRYLGLIDKSRDEDGIIFFQLSALGRRVMKFNYKERQLAIVSQILAHKVFSETLKLHLKCGEMPNKQTIIQIMKRSNLYHIEDS